jgi:hypothetical protein
VIFSVIVALGNWILFGGISLQQLDLLDLIHCICESEQSFRSFDFMVHAKLYFPHIVIQILLGGLSPILLFAAHGQSPSQAHLQHRLLPDADRVFAMRWNVVIGALLFSRSLLGYTTYKMGFVALEGLVVIVLSILPFAILWGLIKLLPPWKETHALDP